MTYSKMEQLTHIKRLIAGSRREKTNFSNLPISVRSLLLEQMYSWSMKLCRTRL